MRSYRLLTALLLAGSVMAGPAIAASLPHGAVNDTSNSASASNTNAANPSALNASAPNANAANANNSSNLANADSLMQNSQGVVSQMQSDSNVANLMSTAKGVFIIPNSSRGGTVPAGGVLMTRTNGRWSNPVFFSVGSATPMRPGTSGSTIAMLVMTNRALNQIRSGGNLSLNGNRRLHIISYSNSGNTQPAALQRSDMILWSGASGNTLPSVTIRSNTAQDQAVYGTSSPQRIAAGHAPLTNQLAVNLANQLPQAAAPTQVGSNQTGTTQSGTTQPATQSG